MEKQNKIQMIYGYAVCLVAVITLLICVTSFVNAIIDLGDPLHAERDFQKTPSLASFENYKMDILSSSEKELNFTPDEQTLRAMYESAKDDKIQSVKHRTNRDLIVNGLLIVLCAVLFTAHWRWMRKLSIKQQIA
jgi:uncharacterized membrane protein YidH (DUF202 family)